MTIRTSFVRRLAIVAFLSVLSAAAGAAPAKKAIIISWDGAADWVMDRLLTEGRLPNVARVAKAGARADYCVPAFPSKTACGHAALWTGAYADVNGITGNAVPLFPRGEHTLLEQRSGFDSASLRAEPLFLTAAKAGKKVVILSATQAFPPDRWVAELRVRGVPEDRFLSFSGFESSIAGDAIHDGKSLRPAEGWTPLPPHNGSPREFSAVVGEQTFYFLVYDDPADPVVGADTLLIRQESRDAAKSSASATLKPAEATGNVQQWSPRFRVTKGDLFGYTYFRLFALAPEGGLVLYQRAVNGLRGAAPREEIERYLDAYGGFHAAPFNPYENGALGKTLWQGGDGTAERRLLECIRLDIEFLKRGTRYAIKRWNPDLLHHYTPWSDSAGHMWMGALDPASPRYDPALAQKLWPFYAQVFELQDDWLGAILREMDRESVLCLVSDHGMEGVGRFFAPNAALEKAGLVARTSENRIDLARTKVCAPPWGDFFVCVNGTDWKGGVVPPAEREAVLRAAADALLAATDPATGQRIVTGVFRPEEMVGIGMGGPTGGDLYIELAPGYYPTNRPGSEVVQALPLPIGGGMHGYFPLRPKMQAVCFFVGAGVPQGVRLPGLRQIDVAPTLARLLGIPAPKDAQGNAIAW